MNRDDFNIIDHKLSKLTNKKRTDTKGITLHCYADWYDNKSQYGGFDLVQSINTNQENYGFNFLLDQYDIVEAVKESSVADPFGTKKPTYIATNLYENKISENTLSICIFISKEHNYEETEKVLVKFLAYLLNEYKLKTDDIWRGHDLSKDDKGPIQYLDTDIFKKLLKEVDDYIAFISDDDNKDKEFEFVSPFKSADNTTTVEEAVNKIFDTNKDKIDDYVNQFEPWDKEKAEIKQAVAKPEVGNLKTKTFPTKNKLQYKITNTPPGSATHCVKASDRLEGIETEEDTFVEPIYPDLITPPGGEINIANGSSETAVQSSSSSTTPISVEDFEKRQKTFDMKDFSNVKKETVGRPINTDDPFPVDEQIKKLEEHFPKVKIDKTTFDFTEDNHPGSAIGKAMAKNYAMTYDMVNEISKRTEKRLVKIENNLATVMRNMFRMSSRVNINCVYYGGQSVYGKYKCIRCLHDNRIDDGAIVTMDQCLCCTRYEPILGQVYAILDETGSNVSQVVDDLQMSYMELYDYQVFNNVNEYNTAPKDANLKKDSTDIPKEFRDTKWADTAEEKKAKAELKAKRAAAANVSGEPEVTKKDEKILITYEEVKEYLDTKLQEVIILDSENKQLTKDEYIIIKKYEMLKAITDKINEESTEKKYKDDSGNDITREDYIKLLTKKFKDSYVSDEYYNGFKMDWTPNLLETHKANINVYDVEKLKDGKSAQIDTVDHQPSLSRDLFIDSREEAIEYEKLEFNIKDYDIGDFSGGVNGSSSSGGIFGGMGSTVVRNKIVEYAKNAVTLCAEGKAKYSQGQRMLHDDKAVNGISYWDCSSLVQAAYEAGGITGVTGNTCSEYPSCLDTNGGLLIPIAEVDKAIPGDIVWFYSGNKPTDQAGLQTIDYSNASLLHHVAIYIGDGKIAHASGENSTPNIKISDLYSEAIAFGRPKDLIELDRAASTGASGPGVWNREAQGIDDELWNASSVADEQVPAFIANMAKYGYKDAINNISKEFNFDPYVIAAMATIETTGNPHEGSTYKGILQVENGSEDPTTNIRQALEGLMARKPYLVQNGWSENNIHVLVSAHNSGEGTVGGAKKASNLNLASCKIPEMGEALYNYVKATTSWDPMEKKTYTTKVLRAYALLYSQNALS
jgi:hypothetical protein